MCRNTVISLYAQCTSNRINKCLILSDLVLVRRDQSPHGWYNPNYANDVSRTASKFLMNVNYSRYIATDASWIISIGNKAFARARARAFLINNLIRPGSRNCVSRLCFTIAEMRFNVARARTTVFYDGIFTSISKTRMCECLGLALLISEI